MNTTIIFYLAAVLFTSKVGASQNADMALARAKDAETALSNIHASLDGSAEYVKKLTAINTAQSAKTVILENGKADKFDSTVAKPAEPTSLGELKQANTETDKALTKVTEFLEANEKVKNLYECDDVAGVESFATGEISHITLTVTAADQGTAILGVAGKDANTRKDEIWAEARQIAGENKKVFDILKGLASGLIELAQKKQAAIDEIEKGRTASTTLIAGNILKDFTEATVHNEAYTTVKTMVDSIENTYTGVLQPAAVYDHGKANALVASTKTVAQSIQAAINAGFVSDNDDIIEVLDTSKTEI